MSNRHVQWEDGHDLVCRRCSRAGATYGLKYQDRSGFDGEIIDALCKTHYKKDTQRKRIRKMQTRLDTDENFEPQTLLMKCRECPSIKVQSWQSGFKEDDLTHKCLQCGTKW